MMKRLFSSMLFILCSMCQVQAQEDIPDPVNKVCVNIPGRGINTEKIQATCQKGDLIQVNEKNMPFYCDFNYAIAAYNLRKNLVCVYIGYRRELRDGTNY